MTLCAQHHSQAYKGVFYSVTAALLCAQHAPWQHPSSRVLQGCTAGPTGLSGLDLDVDLGQYALAVGRPPQSGQVGPHGFYQVQVQLPRGHRQRALEHVVGVRVLRTAAASADMAGRCIWISWQVGPHGFQSHAALFVHQVQVQLPGGHRWRALQNVAGVHVLQTGD